MFVSFVKLIINQSFRALIPCFIFWILCFLLISPAGNFPLNDDWIYSTAVNNFLESGRIRIPWVSPSCNIHILIGAFFCSLAGGFSHEILRCVTVFFAFASVLLLFAVLRSLSVPIWISGLAAFCLSVNPIALNLSFSFMTDVAANFFVLLFLLFLIKWLQSERKVFLTIAFFSFLLAIGVRQTCIVFILPSYLMAVVQAIRRRSGILLPTLLLVVVPVGWSLFMEWLMLGEAGNIDAYIWYKNEVKLLLSGLLSLDLKVWARLVDSAFCAIFYQALFVAPLTILVLPSCKQYFSFNRVTIIICMGSVLVVFLGFIELVCRKGGLMPFCPNIWGLPWLGPQSILPILVSPKSFYTVSVTCASIFAAFFLLLFQSSFLLSSLSRFSETRKSDFVSFISSLDLGSLIVSLWAVVAVLVAIAQTMIHSLDRYYFFALAPVILWVCVVSRRAIQDYSRPALILGFLVAAALGVYAGVAQYDYMILNRARWELIEALEKSGIPSALIDGGFEYNFLRDPKLTKYAVLKPGSFKFSHRGVPPMSKFRWWPVQDTQFVITKEEYPGWKTVDSRDYLAG